MITAALVLALVLFIAILASGSNWSNVLSPTRNELVFADRNRAYGAYAMRREHHGVMLIAFFASLGLVGGGLALPKLLSSSRSAYHAVPATSVEVDLGTFRDKPPARAEVKPAAPKQRNPDAIPIAVDTASKAPVDTTSRKVHVDPIGPTGPGLDTLGGKGPDTGGGGLPRDSVFSDREVDRSPEYPGGLEALYKDLQRMVRYPEIDLDAGRQGRVSLSFVVAEDGSITDVVVLRGVSGTLDAEAMRVVRKLKKWKPGQFNGEDVKVRYSLPIVFKLAKQ